MKAEYHFQTTWVINAPLNVVWDEFIQFDQWPQWWEGLEKLVAISHPSEKLTFYFVWKLWLIYMLRFTLVVDEINPYKQIKGIASGDLAGEGIFLFQEKENKTHILYTWKVVTTKIWMNLLAPIARPIFIHNHNMLMKQGGEGLAKQLHTSLLAHDEIHS